MQAVLGNDEETGATSRGAKAQKGKKMKLAGYIFMLIGGALIIYIRLTNIDVTETRLFIDNFAGYVTAVMFVIAGYLLVVRDEAKK